MNKINGTTQIKPGSISQAVLHPDVVSQLGGGGGAAPLPEVTYASAEKLDWAQLFNEDNQIPEALLSSAFGAVAIDGDTAVINCFGVPMFGETCFAIKLQSGLWSVEEDTSFKIRSGDPFRITSVPQVAIFLDGKIFVGDDVQEIMNRWEFESNRRLNYLEAKVSNPPPVIFIKPDLTRVADGATFVENSRHVGPLLVFVNGIQTPYDLSIEDGVRHIIVDGIAPQDTITAVYVGFVIEG